MDPADPELPPDLERRLRVLAGASADVLHPPTSTLVRYEEAPDRLSARTRSWIEVHLVGCVTCRSALRVVPALGRPASSWPRRLGPLTAAAGWLLAAFLGLRWLAGESPDHGPVLPIHSLVLSSPRGDEPIKVPAEARYLRLELVLGEEVPLGARLWLTIEDPAGQPFLSEALAVTERNARDWPVLTLDRARLPRGKNTLRVRTPGGLEARFVLEL